jgi:MoxR-like ATPase
MQSPSSPHHIARRLVEEVLNPIKTAFTGKDEIVDLLGLCLVAGENLFLLGPPGTAKSALVHQLGARLRGHTFDYLLTRFTEPNELFGPFDIRRLREGELVTNTEGMLPEASLVFLDEMFNANSSILNSLLTALNERIFRRGRETRPLHALMFVGASNHLPEDEGLRALFDRFLLRVLCDNVPPDRLSEVLATGWQLHSVAPKAATLSFEELRPVQTAVSSVDVVSVRPAYAALVQRIRAAGIPISDRRAVRIQRLIAASALLCGRMEARVSDFWVLRYIWDAHDQREVLTSLVEQELNATESDTGDHPRARGANAPDPEQIARELESVRERLNATDAAEGERASLHDRLTLLRARTQWIVEPISRQYLEKQIEEACSLATTLTPHH